MSTSPGSMAGVGKKQTESDEGFVQTLSETLHPVAKVV